MTATTTTLLNSSDKVLDMTPDGQYLSYVESNGNNQTLYVLDLNNGQKTQVDTYTSFTYVYQGDTIFNSQTGFDGGGLSPNGQFIFYSTGVTSTNISQNQGDTRFLYQDLPSGPPSIDITPTLPANPAPVQLIPITISNDGFTVVYGQQTGNGVGQDQLVVENLLTGSIQTFFDENGGSGLGVKAVQLTADGRYLAFTSENAQFTVVDLQTNTSVNYGGTYSVAGAISGDGRYVVYAVNQNGSQNLYIHDNDATSAPDRAVSASASGVVGNGFGLTLVAVSGDGRHVLFDDDATNLVPGVTDGKNSLYLKDMDSGAISVVALDTSPHGQLDYTGMLETFISNDGSRIVREDSAGDITLTQFTPPTLTINPIAGDDYVNAKEGLSIAISGTSNAIGQVVSISVPNTQLTATAIVQADGTWKTAFIFVGGLGDGADSIHAVVTDELTTTVDRPFIVDRTPPADVAITAVAGDNIINAAELTHAIVSGTVLVADPTGAGTDAGSLKISIDGGGSTTFATQPSGSLADAAFSQAFNASGVTDGEHTITLTATDPAGNITTVTKQVLVDTTPPKIAIASISGDDVINPTELKTAQGIQGTSDAIGQTVTISLNGNAVAQAVVQADGTWLTTADFSAANSGENLVTAQVDDEAGNPGEASGNVYVDRGFSAQQLSDGPAGQQGGGGGVVFPVLDAAGDKLVFTGVNFNLMSTATGSSGAQVYIKDLTTGAITFATPDSSENAEFASISPDGRYIEFVSNANLDPTDQSGTGNPPGYYLTYTEDLTTNAIYFHSLSDDAYDGTDPDTYDPGITPGYYALGNYPDGTPIASLPVFPLAIADGGNGLELIDDLEPDQSVQPLVMTTGIRLDVSYVDGDGKQYFYSGAYTAPGASPPEDNPYGRFVIQEYAPQISADGSVVAFEARFFGELWDTSGYPPVVTIEPPTLPEIYAGPAPPGDEEGNDPVQELASSYADGTPMPFGAIDPALSANGKFVAFWSWNNDDQPEVYVKNLTTGELDVASSDALGNAGVGNASGTFNAGFNSIAISADGRYIAFTSDAILTPDDSGTGADLFIKDMQTGAITRLNLPAGTFASNLSTQLTMTADGGYIAFTTSAGLNPLDNNTVTDIYGVSVAAAESTPPQITISPVTGNDRIDAAEDSTHVTVSGTSDAIGGTVTLYVDGGFLPGVTVGSGGTWSTTFDATSLTDGVHQLRATVTASGGTTDTVGDLITIDRVAPTVALSADNTHLSPGQSATLSAHFSEGIGNVTAGFLSATGGTLSNPVFVDDHTLTELFTPTSGATAYSVTANAGTYFDYAGNAGLSGATIALGVPVGSGTTVISSGQTVTNLSIQSGGTAIVSGGTTQSATVSSGGSEVIGSGGTTLDTMVSSGGSLIVSSGGVADPTTVNSGGSEIVSAGGTDLGAIVSGGRQVVFGTASGVTVFAGTQVVRAGGIASGSIVSSGGVLNDFGSAFAAQIGSGGTDVVQSTGVDSGAVLSNGGTALIEHGGRTFGLTVLNGALVANSGGTASGTIIGNGGLAFLESGSVETGAVLSGGGTEFLYAGATALGLTILDGGVAANSGGAASGTMVDSGGLDYLQSGSVETAATLSGGTAFVGFGGTALGLVVSSGGVAANFGGSASGTVVRNGGLDYLESGSVESGAVVSSGGIAFIETGGSALGLTVSSGGVAANFGGAASATIVNTGGLDYLELGSLETSATLSGGTEYIEAGGIALGLTVLSGGVAANFGGSASGTVVQSGGQDYLEAGAVETGAVLLKGGIAYIEVSDTALGLVVSGGVVANYGAALGTIVSSGGSDFIESNGIESGATLLSGGVEYISAGGTALGLTVAGGGTVANYGGSASGTIVSSGGQDYLESGAVETGATILRNGAAFIESGGTAIGITVSGLVDLTSGGVISGTVNFGSRGQLQLADSQDFTNLVAGFSGTLVKMDLQDISYVSGATTVSWTQLVSGSNGSGTLTVSGGGHTANITLIGQYATGNFVISSDGGTGTLVTDPPLTQTDSATVLVNPHH